MGSPVPEQKRAHVTVQTVRYVTVGCVAGLSDMGLYTLLVKAVGLHPLQANLLSRPVGGLISFTLNKLWTFQNRGSASTGRQFLRYLCIWLPFFAGSESLVGLYHGVFHMGKVIAKPAAECTLGMFSFLLQKFWTFR